MVFLRAIASALPQKRISSADVAACCGSDAGFLIKKIGIEERRFLSADESGVDLAASACTTLFERHTALHPMDVGLCFFVGQVQDQGIPHSSALLQARLGLPDSCACVDIGLACSGFVYALALARGIMQTEGIRHGLIVTCDPYSRILNRQNRDTMPLFGDAATATWVSLEEPGARLGLTDMGTDGSGAEWLHCPAPTEEVPFPTLVMNGRGIFQFAVKRVPRSIDRCLALNGLERSEISFFLLHQANAFIIESLRKALGVEEGRCPITMRFVANTVSSSLPLALEECLPRCQAGMNLILCGFGGGLSWATTTLTIMESDA